MILNQQIVSIILLRFWISIVCNLPSLATTKSFSIVAIADFNIDGFKSPAFFQSCIVNSKSNLFSRLLDIARIINVSLLFWL